MSDRFEAAWGGFFQIWKHCILTSSHILFPPGAAAPSRLGISKMKKAKPTAPALAMTGKRRRE
jgi:hypothetical protein